MAYIYRHIRLDTNQPFYIGIGADTKSNYTRAYDKCIYRRNKHWLNITNKTNYEVEILMDNISYDFAKEKEKEFIKLYGRTSINTGILCNLTDGGDGSKGYKRTTPITDETKKKQSLAKIGKKRSVESIEKTRQGCIGKKRTPYQIENLKKGQICVIISPEIRDKMNKARWTEEAKEKAKNQKSCKSIYCQTNNKIYKSLAEAERDLNISHVLIYKVCNNKAKHAKNYIFKYV